MQDSPPRPTQIPEAATWSEESQEWQHGPSAADGTRIGRWQSYRADGSLLMECEYRAGTLAGPFRRFHPSGELWREGVFVDGAPDGVVRVFASDAPGSEPLRGCCVPPGARRMIARYDNGRLLRETFLDDGDRPLLSDGSLRPSRPATVPATAEFEDWSRRWSEGTLAPGSYDPIGTWRWWSVEGDLVEEAVYEDGKKLRRRRFDPALGVVEECGLDPEERLHGEERRRFGGPREGGHDDLRVREVIGLWEHGQAVGPWRFVDGTGATVLATDLGPPVRDGTARALSSFADEDRSAEAWTHAARLLAAERRTRDAVLAMARAVGRGADAEGLRAFLRERVMPLTAVEAEALASRMAELEGDRVVHLLDGLVRGADPVTVLRHLASTLENAPRAARDFVEAAVRLDPERRDVLVTRALVRLELGDVDGALADADRVASLSDETADFLRTYARVLFGGFHVRPSETELPVLPEELPLEVAQPLESVAWAVRLYATRLADVRAAIVRRFPEHANARWLPPDLGVADRVELRKCEATIEDEGESGPELTSVSIDETVPPADAPLPRLLRSARADSLALSWLCWSVGLDDIGIPDALAPNPDYPRAVALALHRAFRAHDGVVTGGLRSMTQGVPGFHWEGIDLDGAPPLFAQMAADEYKELRAALLWLSNPGNISPFQDDLRRI